MYGNEIRKKSSTIDTETDRFYFFYSKIYKK
jgi:hypothetical protein